MIKVGVLGANGKMGAQTVATINAATDLELVAALDLGDSIETLKKSGAEVVVDFTHPDSVMANLEYAINNGINVVVGTTGFDSAKLAKVKELLAKNPKVGVDCCFMTALEKTIGSASLLGISSIKFIV